MQTQVKTLKTIFIEPSYKIMYEDNIFNPTLYQDPSMALPYLRLRDNLATKGIAVHTADYYRMGKYLSEINEYWSFGVLNDFVRVKRNNLHIAGFLLLEPPLIYPKIYQNLSKYSKYFDKIYIYNSKAIAGEHKYKQALIPIPYNDILSHYWLNESRSDKLVLIAGNHAPFFKKNELYSERIQLVNFLSKNNFIDLYGRGWNFHINRRILWWKYLLNYSSIMKSYKGATSNKHETLSKYKFSICFENSITAGYITEKIFDCFYAGTIPIYYGDPNVKESIDPDSYIDFRKFDDYKDLELFVKNISEQEYNKIKNAGKDFILNKASNYYDFLDNIF